MTANPSVEARPNGRPPGPVWWYAYIFTSPGLASCRRSRLTSNVRPLETYLRELVATSKTKSSLHSTPADTTAAVDAFMSELLHPHKTEVEAIRRVILSAAPGVYEGIKWKSPSFRTHEYFATVNLREKNGVAVILHLGAKVRDIGPGGVPIKDPNGLLRWLAKDRAMVVFKDMKDLTAKEASFEGVVQQWITYV